MRGCLAPLTTSFLLAPNLRELNLEKLNMDEHDLCVLLESLRFIPNLKKMSVKGKLLAMVKHTVAQLK